MQGLNRKAIPQARPDNVPTPSCVNLAASYKFPITGAEGFFFARLNNLKKEPAYSAATLAA